MIASSDSFDSSCCKHIWSDVGSISGRGDKTDKLLSELLGWMIGMTASCEVGGVSGRASTSSFRAWRRLLLCSSMESRSSSSSSSVESSSG